MSTYLPVFTSPAGRDEVFAAYQSCLDRWPVPFTTLDVPTSFGQTHVIASGSPEKPPLVLMHALFATALSWYRNVGPLSQHFRTYAVDVLGEANKSRPTRRVRTLDEMARWFAELLDGLGVERANLIGNSFGAFMSAYYAMRLPDRVRRLALIGPAATFHPMMPFYLHMFLPKALCLVFPWWPGQARLMRHSVDWMHAGLPRDPAWEPLFYQVLLHGSMTLQVMPRMYSKVELSQLTAPTLLVIGERERIYRPHQAIRSAQRLVPNIQVTLIPNAHHITALSQPEAVNKVVLEFFHAPTGAASQPQARARTGTLAR